MPAKPPSAPSVTERKSLSLPTQHITKSWPSAAAFGVAAVLPPNFSATSFAFAAGRLYTVTSWPPFFTRWPAIGKPITPRPRKATLAMCATLWFCPDGLNPGFGRREAGRRYLGGGRTINPAPWRATASFGGNRGFCARLGALQDFTKKG